MARPKKRLLSRNREASHEELANDPSLEWNEYRKYELLESDSHGHLVRFLARAPDGSICVTNLACGPYPGSVPALSVRRAMGPMGEEKGER